MDGNGLFFGGFESLLEHKYIDGGAMYAEIDAFRYKNVINDNMQPLVQHVVGTILVVHGSMDINIDFESIHSTHRENNLIKFHVSHTIYDLQISSDFKGYVLILNRQFMMNHMGFVGLTIRTGSPFNHNDMGYTLTSQDKQVVMAGLSRIECNMLRESHHFFHEMVVLSVIEVFLEITNIIAIKNNVNSIRTDSRRRSEICHEFRALLIEHVCTERSVAFYADKLCITSQYLTKVLKKEFGSTANAIIDIALVSEATRLLRMHNKSISDIVDELHFSDQASFSKFFRKHTGVSPARFRKSGASESQRRG